MEDPLKFDLEARQVTIHHAKLLCRNGLFHFVVVMIMIIMICSGLTHPRSLFNGLPWFLLSLVCSLLLSSVCSCIVKHVFYRVQNMFKKPKKKKDVGILCASLWGTHCPVLFCYDPSFRFYTVGYLMPVTSSEPPSRVQTP